MTVIEKLESRVNKAAYGIETIGLLFFLIMMIVTTVDVIGTKLFLLPLPGSQDIMMYAQLIAMSFAIGSGLLLGRHIQVEFFMPLFPVTIQKLSEVVINLLGLALFALIAWRLFVYGIHLLEATEVSPTIQMPLFPFAIAAALACVPVSLIYLLSLITSIIKVFRNES